MPQDLVSYIKQQLQAGYDINTIKSALQKYGYNPSMIDSAVKQAYGQQAVVKHVIHFSPATIAAVALVLILVAAGVVLVPKLTGPGTPKELLDVKVDITSYEITPGSTLEFDVGLMNLGSEGRYDITLRHLIINLENKVMKTKEETVAVETRFTSKSDVDLPRNLPPGNYQLKVIARYNGKIATAVETFSVSKLDIPRPVEPEPGEPTLPEEPTPVGCDDGDPCTQDMLIDDDCQFIPVTPCCGNGVCDPGESYASCSADCEPASSTITEPVTVWEQLALVEDKAATNPSGAAADCAEMDDRVFRADCYSKVAEVSENVQYCDSIDYERTKDKCIKNLAAITGDSALCDTIVRDSIRDQCYMAFVTQGDYSFCVKLTNPFLQQNCNQLKQLGV